eukprot:5319370-Pyramimonas_sp.AAC.1
MTKALLLRQVTPLSLLPPGFSANRQDDEGATSPCHLHDEEDAPAISASIWASLRCWGSALQRA